MIDARLAYALGLLLGAGTATAGWAWLARHPGRLDARHARTVTAYNRTHGPDTLNPEDAPIHPAAYSALVAWLRTPEADDESPS